MRIKTSCIFNLCFFQGFFSFPVGVLGIVCLNFAIINEFEDGIVFVRYFSICFLVVLVAYLST